MAEREPSEYGKTWNCNTGDLLVCDSLLNELEYESWKNIMIPLARDPIPLPSGIDFDAINNEFDACILRGSNYINDHLDLQPMADFINGLKIPFIPIGLGLQAPGYTSVSLSPGTRNFISALSNACELVGVRGNFSAEQLASMNVSNLEVIGCPSLYRTRMPNIRIQKKPCLDNSMRVGVTTNRFLKGAYAANEELTKSAQKLLMEMVADRPESLYISQGETDEFLISRRVSERYDDALDRVLRYFDADASSNIAKLIVNRNNVYFDVGNWAKHVSSLDFIVGLRLHGNIIALQEGVPALFITYDSRVREICEFMHLPFIDVSNPIAQAGSLDEMYESADFTSFEQTYQINYRTFVRFLERNGLSHTLAQPAHPSVGTEVHAKVVQKAA